MKQAEQSVLTLLFLFCFLFFNDSPWRRSIERESSSSSSTWRANASTSATSTPSWPSYVSPRTAARRGSRSSLTGNKIWFRASCCCCSRYLWIQWSWRMKVSLRTSWLSASGYISLVVFFLRHRSKWQQRKQLVQIIVLCSEFPWFCAADLQSHTDRCSFCGVCLVMWSLEGVNSLWKPLNIQRSCCFWISRKKNALHPWFSWNGETWNGGPQLTAPPGSPGGGVGGGSLSSEESVSGQSQGSEGWMEQTGLSRWSALTRKGVRAQKRGRRTEERTGAPAVLLPSPLREGRYQICPWRPPSPGTATPASSFQRVFIFLFLLSNVDSWSEASVTDRSSHLKARS